MVVCGVVSQSGLRLVPGTPGRTTLRGVDICRVHPGDPALRHRHSTALREERREYAVLEMSRELDRMTPRF